MQANTSPASAEPVISPSSDDFEVEGGHTSKKRKSIGSKRQNARSGDRYDIGIGESVARRHDLREIAERGGGGRVMFVFEKVSKSKILPK
jgi:DNA repair and recombination protein RAD54B